jgi:hypothetical protein
MSEAVQTYNDTNGGVRLSTLFINPAGDISNTYQRFPSKYRTKLALDIVDFFQENKKSFQIKEFCQTKGITFQELQEMTKDNATLCRALEFARESCEVRLVQMGKDSPTMIALALKNLHEWRDRQASDEARQSITVNLHLPQRDGAVMAKYEVIESKPVKAKVKKVKSGVKAIGVRDRIALEAKADIEAERAKTE